MAKNWTSISTINDIPKSTKNLSERNSQNRKNSNMIRNVKSLDVDKLKEIGDSHYEEKANYENSLVEAYKNKKLKSKDLIKQARTIKAEKDKAARKAEKKEATNTESVATA